MGEAINIRFAQLVEQALGHRVVKKIASEIKSKTKRRGKLRTFLRSLFHAKNEKEVIAGWTSDLNIILGVFNVGSASPVRQALTVSC